MLCRKNQATLTGQEKSRFVAAVLALKANGTYDHYVQDHMNFMQYAHRGPAFFPWHREFLRRFEFDLHAIDSSVTLPYWDWTVANSPTSSIWDPSFMGGNGRPSDGQVTTGPFALSTGNWPLNVESSPAFGFLRRRFGVSASALPTASDVAAALAVTPYDVAPFNAGFSTAGFRNRAEGWFSGPQLHNLVHVWVGGSMGQASSPNDPVFFLHHCFVDKLWADWQRLHPTERYLPIAPLVGRPGHSLNEAMEPWAGCGQTVTSASVLDHHALGYGYDTEAVCAPTLKFRDDIMLKFRLLADLGYS
jgi:tyrosinase